ncbi:MAG: DUF5596 domain-containing protein [Clostridia bacterium]|nr:DUF5596 domain-containing protein [Clostridia bacterium]
MTSKKVRDIIEKYYKLSGFPAEYDREFYEALDKYDISPDIEIETYDKKETDPMKNLLSYLYLCDKLKKRFEDRNIPEEFFFPVVEEIKKWTFTHISFSGSLGLSEVDWLALHLKGTLFKLGRLQFCTRKCNFDVPETGLFKGEDIIDMHIPKGEPLLFEECKKSVKRAKEFFAKYFPEYSYTRFICHSWLLDTTLSEILPESSNIIKFQSLFDIYDLRKSDDIINYVFGWKKTRADLDRLEAKSSLAVKVKERLEKGGDFYIALGIIDKEKEL